MTDHIEAIAQKHADYYDEPLGMHTRQLVAAEIEAAREEGRRAGMMEAAEMVRQAKTTAHAACLRIAAAIEAKAKEV